MSPARLNLIERLDPYILPRKENREDVGRALARLGSARGDEDHFRQIGAWLLVGMTSGMAAAWPCALALWEMQNGWDSFREMVDRTMHSPDSDLVWIYDAMMNIRTGGHTIILEPVPGSPTFEQAIASPDRGNLMLLEEARVASGREHAYLEELLAHTESQRQAHGMILVGLYTDAFATGYTNAIWRTENAGFAAYRSEGFSPQWLSVRAETALTWRQELWTAAPESRFFRPHG